jgi:hypothetical protein
MSGNHLNNIFINKLGTLHDGAPAWEQSILFKMIQAVHAKSSQRSAIYNPISMMASLRTPHEAVLLQHFGIPSLVDFVKQVCELHKQKLLFWHMTTATNYKCCSI